MSVEKARHEHCERIAALIVGAGRGKVSFDLALRRSRQYIARAAKRPGCHAFVWHGGAGFLFAEDRHAFDVAKTQFCEVHVLLSERRGASLALLRHLRSITSKRILVQSWAWFGRIQAFRRLLRPLRPEVVGETLQI